VSPIKKAALAAIRLVAVGCIVLSICLYLPDIFELLSHQRLRSVVMLVIKAIPLVAGIWLFWKSDAIAEQLTRDLD
jgi:hypothetical protein